MEKSAELLERVAASEPIARKLDTIQRAQWPVRFSHVIQPGQPFLAAVLAKAHHGRRIDKQPAADSTIWVLCPSVHSQEVFYESLLNWQPDALFLPEAELTRIENVLPDPEITAERLALFLQIERDTGPRIIVATRAGLDQAAPKRGSLESAVVQLRRGATTRMEEFLERLAASGYERVSQVTTRGHFAVRGGVVDLYSWQAPLPFRLEFFGDQIESLREFDIDTQTSVRDLRSIDILFYQGAAAFQPPGRSGDHPSLIETQSGNVRDYVRERDLIIDIEPAENSTALWSEGARAPESRRVFSRLNIDDQIALANVVANVAALIFYQGRAISRSPRQTGDRRSLIQQNIDRPQIAHGSLRIDVELAQRFDLVAEKFQSKRQWRVPRIKIYNPAADSELSASGDL